MKILTFSEFVQLPEGTIYSYYEPAICRGLYRKGGNLTHDGIPTDFWEASVIAECVNGDFPKVEHIESRWGLYDYDQCFAVYDEADIALMIKMLSSST